MIHSLPELPDDGRCAERPILFSGAMVRAVLKGRKTQTRRVAKCLLPYDKKFIHCASSDEWKQKRAEQCPYGKPGDLLWVRETFGENYCGDGEYVYRADCPADQLKDSASAWTPSIHMPRWASRITLEITDVRVERVQDISEKDAYAEGCDDSGHPYLSPFGGRAVVNNFASLWNSINEKRGYGWDKNPWVWVVSFRRAERAA